MNAKQLSSRISESPMSSGSAGGPRRRLSMQQLQEQQEQQQQQKQQQLSKVASPFNVKSSLEDVASFVDWRDTHPHRRSGGGKGGSAPLIREKLRDTFLLVGGMCTLRCRVEGQPMPRCYWYHNNRLLVGDDDRIRFAQSDDGVVTLCIAKARVSDIGVYRCSARNPFGLSVTKCKLRVGDTPDRPTRPIVAQHSSEQALLVWDAPAFDGNSHILCYKVDYKPHPDDTTSAYKWTNAHYTIQECCLIEQLEPARTYIFRVSCINTIGVSSYSWASEPVTMLAAGAHSQLAIDQSHVTQLLDNQYQLERRHDELALIKRLHGDERDIDSLNTEKKTPKRTG